VSSLSAPLTASARFSNPDCATRSECAAPLRSTTGHDAEVVIALTFLTVQICPERPTEPSECTARTKLRRAQMNHYIATETRPDLSMSR
jgi:hypothetical protein